MNLDVRPGEIFGVMGPTGSGKTTLLRILAGRIRGYSGSVSFLERDYRDWSRDFYESVSASLDAPALFNSMSARENLSAFARLYKGSAETIPALLEKCGLASEADRLAGTLSPGSRKRLDLARSLMTRPACLIVDEPLADLEGAEASLVMNLLTGHKRAGRSVVLATSDASLIHGLCDRWVSLAEGAMTGMRERKDS